MLPYQLTDEVKPDEGECECDSEMDPDETKRKETLNDIIKKILRKKID